MSVRQDLADAANAVQGITAHPYVVADLDPGTTYVRLERIDYPNPFGGVLHLNVVVILPQDLAAAEQYIEAKVPALRAAIEEHLVVTSVTPQRLDLTGVGVVPCVFINGHTEEN